MGSLFKTRAVRLLSILLAALILGAAIAAIAHTGSSPLSTAVVTVTKPLRQFSAYASNALDSFCDYFRSSDTLQKENAALKQKIADYQGELADYENMKRTLSVYEEFLGVKEENPDFVFCSAGILTKNTESVYGTMVLNKGQSDGVAVDDPVIYGKNLVGIVEKVTPVTCTVKTIANPNFSAAVYETRSNEIGYVTGFDDGIKSSVCMLPGLSKTSGIAAGGVICTLGLGGVFPKDLIVGTVTEVEKSKTDISNYAEVESNVDLSEIKNVFIITDFDGQGVSSLANGDEG